MPPRKRPAWVDPVDEQPPPRAPPPKRSQYVHPEDDPDYVKPPPKRPSPKGKAAPVRERPEWNSGGEEPGYDPKYPPPVWAQEIVSLHGRGFKHLDQDVYVHPEDDPNWKGPPRPDFEKSTIDQSWGGRRVDCPTAKMVWRCPACLAEWEADEPVTCPRCHTKEEPPRPTYGIMFPLIEAMQMIDDGEDPRHGRIDARLDQLMKEQIEAVGGKRKAPPKRAPVGDGKRRVIVIDPSEPVRKLRDEAAEKAKRNGGADGHHHHHHSHAEPKMSQEEMKQFQEMVRELKKKSEEQAKQAAKQQRDDNL